MKKGFITVLLMMVLVIIASAGCGDETATTTGNADLQKQVDELKGALPKFAIPMREVGDRFNNMYFAANGGNWALAAYESKYMDKAMNPAKVTKPDEYAKWASFYTGAFDPVNKAIAAKDINAFDAAYTKAISDCNACHSASGYKFIEIQKESAPTDTHSSYTLTSEPTDVPK